MLCYFQEDGNMIPQRFRIESDDHGKLVFNIKKVQKVEFSKIAGVKITTFVCQILTNNQLKLCEIRYNYNNNQWFLFKI